MLNHIVLMGRLTRDPELRRTGSGVAVASFTLAVDRDYAAQGAEKETDLADNVYFGDSKRDSADGGFNQSQGYAQSFNQIPQQPQPAYQAPQNVSAASSDFSMLSDDDPELPF